MSGLLHLLATNLIRIYVFLANYRSFFNTAFCWKHLHTVLKLLQCGFGFSLSNQSCLYHWELNIRWCVLLWYTDGVLLSWMLSTWTGNESSVLQKPTLSAHCNLCKSHHLFDEFFKCGISPTPNWSVAQLVSAELKLPCLSGNWTLIYYTEAHVLWHSSQ